TEISNGVEESGGQSIRVMRKGSGTEADDLRIVIPRHRTRKLDQGEGLIQISALGIPGEALANFSSFDKVTLKTCTA
ncbi:ATP-binding protein, partial [Staphylococcus aureus]